MSKLALIAALLAALAGVGALFAAPWLSRSRAELTGTVEAREIQLSAEVPGVLLALERHEGERVTRGEVVARIDDAEAVLRVAQADARLRIASAELADLRSSPRAEDLDVQQSRVEEARAAWQRSDRALARLRGLQQAHTISPRDFEAAEGENAVLKQHFQTAQRELTALQAGPRPALVDAAAARVAELEREVEVAKLGVKRATLLSPADGVVLAQHAEPGELLAVGRQVLTILDRTSVWVDLAVPERRHGSLIVGQPAVLTAEAADEPPFNGRVSFIADRHAFTPRQAQNSEERARLSFRVKVAVDEPPAWLKPGMFVHVAFASGTERLHALQ